MRVMLAAVLAFGVANGFAIAQESPPQPLSQNDESAVDVNESRSEAADLPKISTADRLWKLLHGRKLLGLKHLELVSSIAGIDQAGSVRFLDGVHTGQFEYRFRLQNKGKNLVLRFARSVRVRDAVLVGYWTERAEGEPADTVSLISPLGTSGL